MTKLKLYTCVTPEMDYVGLNQYISEWERLGYIERIHIPMLRDHRYISWVGRVGGLALEPSEVRSISTPYEYVLSCQYRSSYSNMPTVLPWNFYVRNLKAFNLVKSELNNIPKTHRSIYSGTIRGNTHERNRWINSTEIFSYRRAAGYNRTNRKYPTIEDYYRALAATRYGLCPVGDCSKCQREVETMGLGCVPVYTTGVEWTSIVDPIENRHFIYADSPKEMNDKIDTIPETTRQDMAKEGIEYFDNYCSPQGLWNSVLITIDKYNIKV